MENPNIHLTAIPCYDIIACFVLFLSLLRLKLQFEKTAERKRLPNFVILAWPLHFLLLSHFLHSVFFMFFYVAPTTGHLFVLFGLTHML